MNTAAWQVLEERVGGVTTTQYLWSPAYVDALVLRDRDADGNGSLEERLFVTQDANWNTTGLVDATGVVKERYLYTPYGQANVRKGDWTGAGDPNYGPGAAGVYAWRYLFQGGRGDRASGLINFRNRDYSPALGRWVQVDPAGYGDGANLYQMEGSNPVDAVDPLGYATRGKGHHVVPWVLFTKNNQPTVPQEVFDVWNGEGGRLWEKGYTEHNGRRYNNVAEPEYRSAVKQKLDAFVEERGKKSIKELNAEEAQEFLDRMYEEDSRSTVGKYREGVLDEMLTARVARGEMAPMQSDACKELRRKQLRNPLRAKAMLGLLAATPVISANVNGAAAALGSPAFQGWYKNALRCLQARANGTTGGSVSGVHLNGPYKAVIDYIDYQLAPDIQSPWPPEELRRRFIEQANRIANVLSD